MGFQSIDGADGVTRLNVRPRDNRYRMIDKAEAHDVTVDHWDSAEMEQTKNYMRED